MDTIVLIIYSLKLAIYFIVSFLSATGIMHFISCVGVFNRKGYKDDYFSSESRMRRDKKSKEMTAHKEDISSLVNDTIKDYEKNFHPLPCLIIEKVYKDMQWIIDALSNKEENKKIEFLLSLIVFRKIYDLIKEDTEKYDAKIKEAHGTTNNKEL